MNADVELICGRILSAILTGGYQGLLLTGLIFAVLRGIRRSSAATRHHICLVTLLLVALLPVTHFLRSSLPNEGELTIPATLGIAEQSSTQRSSHADSLTGRGEVETARQDSVSAGSSEASSFEETEGASTMAGAFLGEEMPKADSEPPQSAAYEMPERGPSYTVPLHLPKEVSVWLVVGGVEVLSLRLLALGWQLLGILRLKRRAMPPGEDFVAEFHRLCDEMKLQRAPKLLISKEGSGPCAAGFWRPAVLAPPAVLEGGTKGAEPILRHELAHIARGDDWASLFQQIVAAVYFFHPAVWLLSHRLSEEREIACDDHVLAARPNRKEYALLLTEFASQSAASRWTAAPAAWNSKSQLKRRIEMILNKHRNTSPRAGRASVGIISATALIAAITAIAFGPQVALADSQAGTLVSADGAELSVGETGDEGGPRLKSSSGAVISLPAPRPAPAPVVALTPTTVSAAVSIAAASSEPVSPDAKPAPRKARASTGEDDRSLERRLGRLEKMVEELAAREKSPKNKDMAFHFNHPTPNVNFNADHFKIDAENFKINEKEMARMQKEIARATKEAEIAVRESQKVHAAGRVQDGEIKHLREQRMALEAQRKSLEKQLKSLEQRIDSLERQEDRVEDQYEREVENEKETAKSKAKSVQKDSSKERSSSDNRQ